MDRQEFSDPGPQYRGVTLWMLNDRLEGDEILRQLKGFAEAGWGAVIGRTFNGLLTPYLGEEWMEIIRCIIEQSKAQGTRVWLQAGYMPSGMPELDSRHAHRGLTRRRADAPGEDGEHVLCEHGGFAYVMRPLHHVLDLLNEQAVADYLDLAYKEPWHSRFGEHFGETVEAIWVDEPHFRPPLLPWAEKLPELFLRTWGYDLCDRIPELFVAAGDHQSVRHHYWRLVAAMFLDGYFRPVGEWCAEHNIKFAGHLMGEDTLCSQIGFTGSCMPCYEYMQLPGIDHLTRSLRWPSLKKFISAPKQISSAAGQLGRKEILCEIYGVSAHSLTFEQRKRIADWMAVLGINYRCYHGSFYSMRGRRKRIYVPHLSYQQPWWPDNRLIADRFARLSYVLRQGRTLADVLVVHPVESGYCLFDPTTRDRPHDRTTEPGDITELDDRLVALCDNLLGIQRNFEFGDEELLLKHAGVDDDGLRVGEMTYHAVVLPGLITIRESTVDLLERFAAAGGSVFSCGALPCRMDGVKDDAVLKRLRFVTSVPNERDALRAALEAAAPADVGLRGEHTGDVWIHGRQDGTARFYFVTNTSTESDVDATLYVRGTGLLEEWDLDTGSASPVPQDACDGGINTPLRLAPLESQLIVQQTDRPPSVVEAEVWKSTHTVDIAGPFSMRRDQPNALTLDTCRLRRGGGAWSEPLPVIYQQRLLEDAGYRGPVTLEFTLHVSEVPPVARVAVENAGEWRIRVNGKSVSYEGLPYYVDRSFLPVDITAAVREGTNVIEMERDYEPVPRPEFYLSGLFEPLDGVEIESIYVLGDFAVTGQVSGAGARPGCVRYAPAFSLTGEKAETDGELTTGGHPFYAGRTWLTRTVELRAPTEGERVMLGLPSLDAVLAKVRVNGRDAGAILWAPYEVEITEFVRDGDNVLELELAGSLRNLLGPHHRNSGDPDDCWGHAFDYYPDAGDLQHPEELESGWTDDYFVVHFGLRDGLRVRYEQRIPSRT